MQVTEKRKFMDIFYINCLSHSLYFHAVTGDIPLMWDLVVSVPDHCLSFYFTGNSLGYIGRQVNSLTGLSSLTAFA